MKTSESPDPVLPITCVCVMSYRGEPSTDHLDVDQLVSEVGEEKAAAIVEPILRGEVVYNYDADGEGDYLLSYYCTPEQREALRIQAQTVGLDLTR